MPVQLILNSGPSPLPVDFSARRGLFRCLYMSYHFSEIKYSRPDN